MAQAPVLDDRYTEGVWYDMEAGDFCRIEQDSETDNVLLLHPRTGDIYYEFEEEEFNSGEFINVPDEAVEDPAHYLQERVHLMTSMDPGDQLTASEEIGVRYCNRNTEIVELEE